MRQVVTANRLRDGLTVFLTAEMNWSQDFGEAAVADDDTAASTLLRTAENAVSEGIVVDPYAFEMEDREGHPRARDRRERIRATGPTVQQGFNTRPHGSDA